MSVSAQHRKLTLGVLLVCLVAGFGLRSLEEVCRTGAASRLRPSRAVRLDDHDHDQSGEGLALLFEFHSHSDSGLLVAGLPESAILPDPGPAFFTPVRETSPVAPSLVPRGAYLSRGPPSLFS